MSVLGWLTLIVSGYGLFFGVFFTLMTALTLKPTLWGEQPSKSPVAASAPTVVTAATRATLAPTGLTVATVTSATATLAATTAGTECPPGGLGDAKAKPMGVWAAAIPLAFGAVPLLFGFSLLATAIALLRRLRWARVAFEVNSVIAMIAALAFVGLMAFPLLHAPNKGEFPFGALLIGTSLIVSGIIVVLLLAMRKLRTPAVRAVFANQ